ncbi:hypothetical protein PanWU01x14_238900 [Parasponia andersonii]|uniref:Uncharacterized protein n=1 Tax=Parasponia andersonii TaxID=3476 RepID=A0A2P5BHH8_PARAD|nr:hypothetical protein PanWU01x14_238900 [Parasponia andersonii]
MEIKELIGDRVGVFLEVETDESSLGFGKFVRIRVDVSAAASLNRGTWLRVVSLSIRPGDRGKGSRGWGCNFGYSLYQFWGAGTDGRFSGRRLIEGRAFPLLKNLMFQIVLAEIIGRSFALFHCSRIIQI